MKPFPFYPCRIDLAGCELMSDKATDTQFVHFAKILSTSSYSGVLLSGGPSPTEFEGRYSLMGWDPFLILETKGRSCRIHTPERALSLDGNPLDVLDEVFCNLAPEFTQEISPFCGGAMGYFAYEMKNEIESLPQSARDDLNLPDVFLMWPRKILIHDRLNGLMQLVTLGVEGISEEARHSFPPANDAGLHGSFVVGDMISNFRHEEYLEAVRKILHYIRQGDLYQVNLSQRYKFPFIGSPYELWESLYKVNPAPFYAFIQGGSHQVLSTSMERFLFRRGQYIETRPIKGTRKRGKTREEDEELIRDLIQNPKDDAELSMIVDLLRNDLGRVCAPRSIRVAEHKRLESYQNVHHLVSIVTGELIPGTTYGQLLRATFPGGSITGCPKIRAMEVIDELEPNVRHVYTGAIGYLGWHENLDLNIAIRTALTTGGACYFSVGGGIVFDSVEEEEYQETLHKGRTLFQLIERMGKSAP